MTNEKKILTKDLDGNFYPEALEGPIEDAIKFLEERKRMFELKGFKNITIHEDNGYHEDINFFVLKGERLETDKEFNRRLKNNEAKRKYDKKTEIKKEEAERKEYERLKKKYEGRD